MRAALANRLQKNVQRLEQLLLDLDVADRALAVALLEVFDFRLIPFSPITTCSIRIRRKSKT